MNSADLQILKDLNWRFLHPWGKRRIYTIALQNGKLYTAKLIDIKNFNKEGWDSALALEQHINILQCISVDILSNNVAILMEHANLPSLEEILSSPYKSPPEYIVREIVGQILDGVKFLHDNNVTHGKLTADSILFQNLEKSDICVAKIDNYGFTSPPDDDERRDMIESISGQQDTDDIINADMKKFDVFMVGLLMMRLLAKGSDTLNTTQLPEGKLRK
ncbi:MAG: hypothetical protein EZS28_000307 [Streblomastix strix]|uniref:Protein kinase domain-containing protein n=1 Tax=Streblomastix strix TaxID=222440 RepID=A0A5J4XAL9_9EUKA|nr:MAG: hypothetical protein EZS28_000307 [Streblomastix strix]